MSSFDGDLDDYQRYLLEASKRLREEASGGSPTPVVVQAMKADGERAGGSRANGSKGEATKTGGSQGSGTKKKGAKNGGMAVGAR